MIKSFRHRGVEKFFRAGSKVGIQPKHANKLRLQLFALDNAKSPEDMNAPGWKLHTLAGDLNDHWAIWVSGNWRLIFRYDEKTNTASDIDLIDYH